MAEKIIDRKKFHHGNLELRLIHDDHLAIYRIEVYRDNSRETFDLWGIWLEDDFVQAHRKFEAIKL